MDLHRAPYHLIKVLCHRYEFLNCGYRVCDRVFCSQGAYFLDAYGYDVCAHGACGHGFCDDGAYGYGVCGRGAHDHHECRGDAHQDDRGRVNMPLQYGQNDRGHVDIFDLGYEHGHPHLCVRYRPV